MPNDQPVPQKRVMRYTAEQESEIFKIALSHVNIHIFVYDISLRNLYFFGGGSLLFGTLKDTEYLVEEIAGQSFFDAEAAATFRGIFAAIHRGETSAVQVLKTTSNNQTSWYHLKLECCSGDTINPVRAIGTIQDISNRVESELRYSQEKKFRTAMLADSRRVYEINVTRDRFIKLESIQDSTDCEGWNLYTDTMANLCKTKIYQEDWETFLKVATWENLSEGYKNGITEFYCEYRVVEVDGTLTWSSSATHLLCDPLSGDIKGFIYVKDIDHQKRRELELYQQAEHDPLTGIYNRRTAERLVTQQLLAAPPDQHFGFLTMDIDEFKQVNDRFGHAQGDFLLRQMSIDIGKSLRSTDVFARMGGDEFVVFLGQTNTVTDMTEIARRICGHVQAIVVDKATDFHATVSVGIAIYPRDGETFAELYKASDHALYSVKQHGKNNVAVFDSTL